MAILSTLPMPNATKPFWLSEQSAKLKSYRSSESVPVAADVAVIGSGISGVFAARALLENAANEGIELSVVMFEAREVCSGASGRNGGHCQPALYSGDAETAKFEMATYDYVDQLIRDAQIDCDWQPRGAVAAFYSRNDLDRATRNLQRSGSVMPEIHEYLHLVTPESKDPSLDDLGVGHAKGAIVNKLAASLWPYKMVARVVEDLVQQYPNFNLQTNTPVSSLAAHANGNGIGDRNSDNGWTLQTSRGSCVARHVLLATNGYTSHLVPRLKEVIQPVRGNMIAVQGGPDLHLKHSYGFVDELSGEEHQNLERAAERLIGDGEYLMQMPKRDETQSPIIAIGGARFMIPNSGCGLSDDSVVDKGANTFLRNRLQQVLRVGGQAPENVEVTHEWTGILGYSADGYPWVGELKKGLWLCVGYSGHGMPQAALCGTVSGAMILERFLDRPVEQPDLPARFRITSERLAAHGLAE